MLPAFTMLPDDPLPSGTLVAYLRGFWAGATSDAWPPPPRGLCPLLEDRWNRGVLAGFTSRIAARQARRAQGAGP